MTYRSPSSQSLLTERLGVSIDSPHLSVLSLRTCTMSFDPQNRNRCPSHILGDAEYQVVIKKIYPGSWESQLVSYWLGRSKLNSRAQVKTRLTRLEERCPSCLTEAL